MRSIVGSYRRGIRSKRGSGSCISLLSEHGRVRLLLPYTLLVKMGLPLQFGLLTATEFVSDGFLGVHVEILFVVRLVISLSI